MIFAFAGNAFFTGLYYSLQRLCKTRMWSDKLSYFHFFGWQLGIFLIALSYAFGITKGKEYAEMEWIFAIIVAILWVAMAINVFATIAIRRVHHLYVAIWFYMASIITIAILHVVNSLAIPVSLFKSYPIYAGVQDALVQWWYGHNAVGFLLTTPFLGLMYYFLPKAVEQPVYSYRLSIIHFWSLVFIYIWAGPHHLLYTSLPEWAQSLGMVFSIMLIAPSWGGMINGLLTFQGAWSKVRTDPTLKFFVMALTFYGMATLEGSLLSIKTFNLITHYTDYTVAHVHSGALGWVGGMVFAMAYYLAPKLWRKPLYSVGLANLHFWLAMVGIILYVASMWAAGITQGLMWFSTNDAGMLRYPQFIETVIALKPLYWFRFFGGVLYLSGVIICLFNLIKTACGSGVLSDTEELFIAERHIEPKTWHEHLENKGFSMAFFATIVVLIGGIIEFVPTFLIESTMKQNPKVQPYSPLELEGRDIYIAEGCYNCHSQMIRTYDKEVLRYGMESKAEEFIYDHPFQWGSKRTGPDLQKVGGKYPDMWHYKHMINPREISPGSIMPSYSWLKDEEINISMLPDKIKVMQKLGVPYSEETLTQTKEIALRQGKEISDRLAKDGISISENKKLVALIAYLQRLGTDLKKERK